LQASSKFSDEFSEFSQEAVPLTLASYSLLADDYIMQTRDFSRFPGLDSEIREFIEQLPLGPVADIGSGSGRDAIFVASMGRRVVAIDPVYTLLHSLTDSGFEGHLLCGNILALPVRDQTFTGAIASGVLLHLPRRLCSQALTEISRVLQAGGRAIISMKHGTGEGWRTTADFPLPRWFTFYDPDDFSIMCQQAGMIPQSSWISARKDWFTLVTARE
jgi:ubiquinone/menaquinone biosynthesis C-methylase UbiE